MPMYYVELRTAYMQGTIDHWSHVYAASEADAVAMLDKYGHEVLVIRPVSDAASDAVDTRADAGV